MKLNHFSCGEGFPLVVLHGLLGSSDNWQGLSKKFAEHFRVYVLDLRNHGASPHSDQFDYPVMAEDVREFMDDHGLGEAYVLGHSMGGKTAMQLAGLYPARVKKLVVADIGIKSYPPHHTQILDALWSLDLSKYSNRHDMDRDLAIKLPEAPLRAFLLKSVTRDEDGKFSWKIDLRTIREKYGNITAAIQIPAPYTGPSLFLRGAMSDYIVPGDEAGIQHLFPAAEFVSIPGAGHWLHAEKPKEVFEAIMEFIHRS